MVKFLWIVCAALCKWMIQLNHFLRNVISAFIESSILINKVCLVSGCTRGSKCQTEENSTACHTFELGSASELTYGSRLRFKHFIQISYQFRDIHAVVVVVVITKCTPPLEGRDPRGRRRRRWKTHPRRRNHRAMQSIWLKMQAAQFNFITFSQSCYKISFPQRERSVGTILRLLTAITIKPYHTTDCFPTESGFRNDEIFICHAAWQWRSHPRSSRLGTSTFALSEAE